MLSALDSSGKPRSESIVTIRSPHTVLLFRFDELRRGSQSGEVLSKPPTDNNSESGVEADTGCSAGMVDPASVVPAGSPVGRSGFSAVGSGSGSDTGSGAGSGLEEVTGSNGPESSCGVVSLPLPLPPHEVTRKGRRIINMRVAFINLASM